MYDFYRRNKRRLAQARGVEEAYHLLLNVTADTDHRSVTRETDQVVQIRRAIAVVKHDFLPHTWNTFWQTTVSERSETDVGRDLNLTPTAVRKASRESYNGCVTHLEEPTAIDLEITNHKAPNTE